jgi:hypothetical protein
VAGLRTAAVIVDAGKGTATDGDSNEVERSGGCLVVDAANRGFVEKARPDREFISERHNANVWNSSIPGKARLTVTRIEIASDHHVGSCY